MKSQLRFAVLALAFFGAMSQSSAASKTPFKVSASVMICDTSESASLCISEPQESPEAVILRNETTPGPSMLMAEDLAGDALSVENDALLAIAVDPLDLRLTPGGAIANAQRATDQLRAVETFLKATATEGDLTVITTGQ